MMIITIVIHFGSLLKYVFQNIKIKKERKKQTNTNTNYKLLFAFGQYHIQRNLLVILIERIYSFKIELNWTHIKLGKRTFKLKLVNENDRHM